eukprot:gene11383-4550_t
MNWSVLCSITEQPPPRFSSASTCNQNRIYMFGGADLQANEKMKNDFYVFDVNLKTWTLLKPKFTPHSRLGHTLVSDPETGFLYLVGGYYRNSGINFVVINVYNDVIQFDSQKQEWKLLRFENLDDIIPRRFHSCLFYKKCLIIFGGLLATDKCSNELFKIDIKNNRCMELESKGDLPKRRYKHSSFVHKGEFYVFGGCYLHNENTVYLRDLYCYNFQTKFWKKVQMKNFSPRQMFENQSVYMNNNLYVLYSTNIAKDGLILSKFDLEKQFWDWNKNINEIDSILSFSLSQDSNDSIFIFGGKNFEEVVGNKIVRIEMEDKMVGRLIFDELKRFNFQDVIVYTKE